MWAQLARCGGSDTDDLLLNYDLKGLRCYFGRSPQTVVSGGKKDASLSDALEKDLVDFCLLSPPYVSMNHFMIKRNADHTGRTIVDLSTNGTQLNGVLIGKNNERMLEHGAKISIKFK